MDRFHCLYEALRAEDMEITLIIVRELSKHNGPVDLAFREWGDCPCCACYDTMVAEASKVLPSFITHGGGPAHIIRGAVFNVRLPELEEALP